jgi:hypothetical protein
LHQCLGPAFRQNTRETGANLGDLRRARQRVFWAAQGGLHALIQLCPVAQFNLNTLRHHGVFIRIAIAE